MKALLVAGITLVFAGFAAAQPADPVANLQDRTGQILLNTGDGYVTPPINAPLMKGDQILTKTNSSVVVHYDDGCDVRVEENTVYTVERPEECPAGIMAVGEGTAVAASSNVPFILAGVGVVALIYIFSDNGDNNDRVVSP